MSSLDCFCTLGDVVHKYNKQKKREASVSLPMKI